MTIESQLKIDNNLCIKQIISSTKYQFILTDIAWWGSSVVPIIKVTDIAWWGSSVVPIIKEWLFILNWDEYDMCATDSYMCLGGVAQKNKHSYHITTNYLSNQIQMTTQLLSDINAYITETQLIDSHTPTHTKHTAKIE